MNSRLKLLLCFFVSSLIFAATPTPMRAQGIDSNLTSSDYIEITQKRLLTIIVTNRASAKPPSQGYFATVINQVPRPVRWLDGRAYVGITNLSFFPMPPAGVWMNVGANYITKQITRQTWQSDPRLGYQWEWRMHGNPGQEVLVVTKYQIVTATRRLRTDKLHLTLADFKQLPPDIQTDTIKLKASLPPAVVALAYSIVGTEDSPLAIIKRISDWTRGHVIQQANDLSGKYITRYNIWPPINEGRGWCGPRSSIFRALCAAYGIPSREVSGYYLSRLDGLVGDEINGHNAHVWAEVYLPQVGWVEIAVATTTPFLVLNNQVPTYGIEDPTIYMVNEQGNGIPCEDTENITVNSVEIPD